MRKTVKLLCLAIPCMIIFSMLGGCNTLTPTTSSSKSASVGTDTSTPELVYWTIGGEPKELAAVNAKVNEYIKGKIGAIVKIKYANWGDYSAKLTTVIQSGESYDIAFGASIANYVNMVQKNYFADLSKFVKEKTPALYKSMPVSLWNAMTFDSKLFGVPAYKDSSSAQYWVWDKSITDKLSIDYKNIKTLEDMEPALKKIKANDPSKYPLPLYSSEGLNGFMSDYDQILAKPLISVKYSDKAATVVDPFEQADVQTNLTTLNKWMKLGYINPDAATLKEAPKYRAVFSAQGYPGADADWTISSGYTVISQQRAAPVYSTSSIQGSFLVVSASSKNIEKSVKFIELINTDKTLRNLLAFGIEGKNYEKTGANTIKVLNDGYSAPAYSQGTFFNMYVVDPGAGDKWDKVKTQNDSATNSPILGFMFDTTKVNNQIAACTTIYDKYYANIMTGTVEPKAEIAKMVKELNAAGMQDIIKEAQSQVNTFMKK